MNSSKNIPKQLNIFIMTDDYKVINEFNNFTKKKNINANVWTLCPKNYDGHSTILIKNNNYNYSEIEMVNFLTEIEIAKNAKYFVGTRSSNIWRFINKTCNNRNFLK